MANRRDWKVWKDGNENHRAGGSRSSVAAGKKPAATSGKGDPFREYPAFNEPMDFKVPSSCISQDENLNEMNQALVEYYAAIAVGRMDTYSLLVEQSKGIKNSGAEKSQERVSMMVNNAKGMRKAIENLGGKAASLPKHFNRKVTI